jgi:hypothetical protein
MTEPAGATGRFSGLKFGIVIRLCVLVAGAFLISWLLNRTAASLEQSQESAGFFRGMVQGALMPCTLPALILGHDVAIYTADNNGVPYKRGYAVGVNLIGAAFFGLLYRRLDRWRNPRGP